MNTMNTVVAGALVLLLGQFSSSAGANELFERLKSPNMRLAQPERCPQLGQQRCRDEQAACVRNGLQQSFCCSQFIGCLTRQFCDTSNMRCN